MPRRKQPSKSSGLPRWLYPLAGATLIALAAWVVYFPSLRGEFILDDNIYLTSNTFIRASDGLYKFWFTTQPIDYYPVSNSSFWIEWRLWGMNPAGYHVTNLLLHVASSLLIWSILKRLSIPGAFLAGLLFAIHPVNVESVAWIAQRKDVLAVFFFLLSVLWYLKDWYWLGLVFFILAMLSKGSVAILPAVLLLLLWWQNGKLQKRDWLRSIPFFVAAIGLTLLNVWTQTRGEILRIATWPERFAGAGAAIWFYISKALMPVNLIFVYPSWRIHADQLRWWVPLAVTVLLTAILVYQRNSRWARALLLAWAFYCIALLPVMGFVDVGFMAHSLVADHYQHLAIIAVVALIAAAWSRWKQPIAKYVTAIAAVAVLMVLSWKQSRLYGDPITLYTTTVERNPDSWLARINLGSALTNVGRFTDAIDQLEQALQRKPDSAEAHNNLGDALRRAGRSKEAAGHFRLALRLKPNFPEAHNNLSLVLKEIGMLDDAIAHGEEALRLAPHYADAHNSLANALLAKGQATQAIEHYEQAIKLDPDFAMAHNNLAVAFMQTGRPAEGIQHFLQSVRLNPQYPDVHHNLGNAMRISGQLAEAIDEYRQAINLQPNFPEAYYNLAITFAQANRPADAIAAAQQGAQLAQSNGNAELARTIENWISSYQRQPNR